MASGCIPRLVDPEGVDQLDPHAANQRNRDGVPLVDVREAHERRAAHIPGSLWVPLSRFGADWVDLPDGPLVLYCAAGVRSQQAAAFLNANGRKAANLAGGVRAWHMAGLPLEPGQE